MVAMRRTRILVGDAEQQLARLPASSVQSCITSPPYWGLRDYGHEHQIGLERTPEAYVEALVRVFRGVHRALRDDGTLWLNLGDSFCSKRKGHSGFGTTTLTNQGEYQATVPRPRTGRKPKHGQYNADVHNADVHNADVHNADVHNAPHRAPLAGYKNKDLIGIPWLVANALREDGWYLRCPIIWAKPNGMPGSQKDRPTINFEFLWLLSKSERYYYDHLAVRNPLAPSTIARLSQPTFHAQSGSDRVNGGTRANRPMKPVAFGGQKYATRDARDGGGGGGLRRLHERERERERERAKRAPSGAFPERSASARTYSGREWRGL